MLAPLNIFLPAISSLPKYFSPEYCPHQNISHLNKIKYFSPEYCPHHPATVTAPCQPHTWLQFDFLKTWDRCNSPQKDWIYSGPLATWSPNLVLWTANIFATSHATVIHKHTRRIVPLQHSLSVCCFLFLSYVCFLRPWRSLQQAANVSWRHSTLKRSRIPSNFSYHWTNGDKHLFGVKKNYDPIILTVFWQWHNVPLKTYQHYSLKPQELNEPMGFVTYIPGWFSEEVGNIKLCLPLRRNPKVPTAVRVLLGPKNTSL